MSDSLLKYWTVFGMFNFAETVLEIILEASQFLLLLKFLFLLLFVSPLTLGYLFVFGRVIQPFLIKREETIETNINSLVKLLKESIIQLSWKTIIAMKTEIDDQSRENCVEEAKTMMSSLNKMNERDYNRGEDSIIQRRWSIDSNSDLMRGMENRDLEHFDARHPEHLQLSRQYTGHQSWRRSAYDINYLDRTSAGDRNTRRRTQTNDFHAYDRLVPYDYRDEDTYNTYYRDPYPYRRSMNSGLNYIKHRYDFSNENPQQDYRYSSTTKNISSDSYEGETHYRQLSMSLRRQRAKSERYPHLY